MYLTKTIPTFPRDINRFVAMEWPQMKQLVFAAMMGALAAIFQSAGGLLPGIGFLISPFATLPILLGMLVSFRLGALAYVLTICLLFLIEPMELLIFPFTTGLLGLGLGWTFLVLKHRLGIIFVNGIILSIGICIPLYGLGFPVFGPSFSSSPNITMLLRIMGFSILYSWLWLELGLFLIRKIKLILLVSR